MPGSFVNLQLCNLVKQAISLFCLMVLCLSKFTLLLLCHLKSKNKLLLSHLNNDNDTILVGLLKQGNMQAFNKLYAKYHKALYANVLKLTKNSTAAEDIVQETFISLWQKRNIIDADKSIAGWLFVLSYHKSVNWQKKNLLESRTQQIMAMQSVTDEIPEETYPLQMQLLQNAIGQLSPQKRRVFELCKLHGKTYEETAAELNISRHTVKEYLSSAMSSVKEYAHAHPEFKGVLPVIIMLDNIL